MHKFLHGEHVQSFLDLTISFHRTPFIEVCVELENFLVFERKASWSFQVGGLTIDCRLNVELSLKRRVDPNADFWLEGSRKAKFYGLMEVPFPLRGTPGQTKKSFIGLSNHKLLNERS
jgi:hypothetical protein